jgi:hypothetical protein
VNRRIAQVFHRHRTSLVALNLWLAFQELRRESQLSLRAFDSRRVNPRAACLRSARVFHLRRVTPRAASLRLALIFLPLRAHPIAAQLRLARDFHRQRANPLAVILWLARQEHRRESQPSLRAFDDRRVTPMVSKLRIARVFHHRRLHAVAVNLWLALVLHREQVTHSDSSAATISPRLSTSTSPSGSGDPMLCSPGTPTGEPTAKLRLARVFHHRRAHAVAVKLWLALVLHLPRVTHSDSSEAMISPRLSTSTRH